MTLSIRTDRQLIRAQSRSNRYVLVSFTAPAAPRRENRMPVNVALVLDRSGSMAGENFMVYSPGQSARALGYSCSKRSEQITRKWVPETPRYSHR